MPLGQFGELVGQVEHARLAGLAVPEAGTVLHVHAVGTGVLADDEKLLHTGFEQALRFAQHIADRARHQVAAHARDDAERAAVVAAFADLQVGVVPGGELDALRGHEVDERIVRLGHVQVHRVHHFVGGVRAGHGEHAGVHLPHEIAAGFSRFRAQAAGDDDLAVLRQRFADCVQRFLDRGVDETAGVDDDEIGAGVVGRGEITLGPELGEDSFGIYERFRAASRDKPDPERGRGPVPLPMAFYPNRLAGGSRGTGSR